MISLTYVSSATAFLKPDELLALLNTARANNVALGLTGMLLYKDGNFMQVLEGEEAPLRQLYRKIEKDRRHAGLIKLLDHPIETRQFPSWSMAFTNLDDVTPASVPGYSEFLNLSFTEPSFQQNPSRAQKLLITFRNRL